MKSQINLEDYYSELLKKLFDEYDHFLKACFAKEFWESGEYDDQRINWKNFKNAKKELNDLFGQSGIYIWGVEEKPLYIGKTVKQTLAKRFRRYVGGGKSICKLAEKYSNHLEQQGKTKSVPEFKSEYNISGSKANCIKKFGESGANKVWFLLLPLEKNELISGLENSLITIGREWNKDKGYSELINLD